MKKISRKDLQGLRGLFPVLEREEMRRYIGGAHGYGAGYYTQDEYDRWEGPWPGGWVEGWGYVFPDEATCYGYYYTPPTTPPPVWVNYEDDYYDYYTDSDNNGYPGYRRPNGYYIYYYDNYDNSGEGGSGGTTDNDNTTNSFKWNKLCSDLLAILKDNSITNAQKWQKMESTYRAILNMLGLDTYGIIFNYSEERSAYAWKDEFTEIINNVGIGKDFFDLSVEDTISVLIHEYMHTKYDVKLRSFSRRDDFVVLNIDSIPEYIKQYAIETDYKPSLYASIEEFLNIYFKFKPAVDPNFYKNELNALAREKELYSGTSLEYQRLSEYKTWLYSTILEEGY